MVAVEAAVVVVAEDLEVDEAVEASETAIVVVDEAAAVEVLAAVAVMEVNKQISQAVLEIGNVPFLIAATQTSPGGMNVTNVKHPNPLGLEAATMEADPAGEDLEVAEEAAVSVEATVIVVVAVALEAEEEDSAAAGVVTEAVEDSAVGAVDLCVAEEAVVTVIALIKQNHATIPPPFTVFLRSGYLSRFHSYVEPPKFTLMNYRYYDPL